MATPLAEGTISVYKYRNSVVGFLLYLSLSLCSYTLAKPSSFYISYRYNLYGLLSAVAVRFFRCKGRLPRLIRRLEVHSPQILPFHESVIGRETHRMKPCRQPCSASVKSRNGSGRERNRKEGKNKQLGNGRTNHLATNNFLLCYMFTLSDASAKIARLFQEYTAHSWLWT